MLHNLRTDKTVLDFANAAGVGLASDGSLVNDRSGARATGGACTAISFRTGTFASPPRPPLPPTPLRCPLYPIYATMQVVA